MKMRLVHAAAAALLAAAAVPAAAQHSPPAALILSPEPGERITADQVLVAVSLPREADSLAVTVRVGSRDVTAQAERSGGVVTWRPVEPLAPGPHRVVVAVARPAGGAAPPPLEWTFSVAPAARVASAPAGARPRPRSSAVPHGSVVMEGSGGSASGPGAGFRREEDFAPRMWINGGGQVRPGWRYTFRGHLSGYESSRRQPVNRFRAELRTPGVSLALGDVNPVLHDIILAGRRVRGGQLDLRAGPLGLSVVAGQSLRAVSGALHPEDPTRIARSGTYAQDLLAVRPSLGAGGFRLGLTVMRVRDDVGSIPSLRTGPSATGTFSVNPAPRDNLVAGLDASLRLARGRIVLQYENAASLLARDISTRPRTQRELDSLFVAAGADPPGIDPGDFDDFFILNASVLPLDPRELTSTAHQARAHVRAGGHLVSAEWRTVGMDYHTLGHPGMQRDWRGLRVRDSFALLRDALFVTAGYEQDRDNLDGSAPATTRGRGGFATLTWRAPREVMVTGSLRLATRENGQGRGTAGALDQSTLAASGGVAVPVGLLAAFRTRVSLNGTWVERSDPANPLADTRDLYFLAGVHAETPSRETSFSLLGGQNRSEFPGLEGGSTTFDRLVAAGRRQLTQRWAVRFDGGLTAARSPASATAPGPRYTRVEALGGGEFAWRPDAVVTLTAGVVDYTDRRIPGLDTRELVMRVRLSRAF
ncbi:MAG TPA: hypothetical protein VFQ45_04555 [Longimicrobium sp.]|nr:hypothetical protein [Longimicrobium sp.]